jgi:hypothetical protein
MEKGKKNDYMIQIRDLFQKYLYLILCIKFNTSG